MKLHNESHFTSITLELWSEFPTATMGCLISSAAHLDVDAALPLLWERPKCCETQEFVMQPTPSPTVAFLSGNSCVESSHCEWNVHDLRRWFVDTVLHTAWFFFGFFFYLLHRMVPTLFTFSFSTL